MVNWVHFELCWEYFKVNEELSEAYLEYIGVLLQILHMQVFWCILGVLMGILLVLCCMLGILLSMLQVLWVMLDMSKILYIYI